MSSFTIDARVQSKQAASPSSSAASDAACYYGRVGRHGEVGRFQDPYRIKPSRNDTVVVRTSRGIEIALILKSRSSLVSVSTASEDTTPEYDGTILRTCGPEDRLLKTKLDEAAMEAFAECQDHLAARSISSCIVDVEAMLDAKTLYFYFLGEPPADASTELEHLATIFQEKVASSQFAQLVENGCGPGCGTKEKGSCGSSGGCAVCVVAKACKR